MDIVYSHESLREIFYSNNIQLEKVDRMVPPARSHAPNH